MNSQQNRHFSLGTHRLLIGSCLLLVCLAGTALGQQFKELQVDESQRNEWSKVSPVLRDEAFGPSGQRQVDTYFKGYAFPRWTHLANAEDLAGYRKELLTQIRTARDPARRYLLQEAFKFFKNMAAAENVYPAARFNAVLLLGWLNEQDRISSQDPVRPLPAALAELIRIYKDTSKPDYLRLAALMGLARHAYEGVADRQVLETQMVPLFLATAGAKTPEGNRTEKVQNWFREWAVRALGCTHWPGNSDRVIRALVALARDPDESLEIRYAAARALGSIDYGQASSVTAAQLVPVLSDLALAVVANELITIEEQALERMGGTGGGYGGEYGGEYDSDYGSSYEEDYGSSYDEEYGPGGYGGAARTESRDVNNSRRRVLVGLGAVLQAIKGEGDPLGGVSGFATDEAAKQQVADLTTKINELVDFFNANPALTQPKLIEQLELTKETWSGEAAPGT